MKKAFPLGIIGSFAYSCMRDYDLEIPVVWEGMTSFTPSDSPTQALPLTVVTMTTCLCCH